MHDLDAYDGSSIEILTGHQAVRRRPGMFVGSQCSRGMTRTLVRVIADAMRVSEGRGEVRVCVMEDRHVRVEQQAWSIPPGELRSSCEQLCSGSVWSRRVPSKGNGTVVARHVSESFEAITHHGGERWMVLCQEEFAGEPRRIGSTPREGMSWSMTLSEDVFGEGAALDFELLQRACDELAVYCAGVRVVAFDERTGASFEAHAPNGIVDRVEEALPGALVFSCEARDEEAGLSVRVAIGWGDTLDSLTVEDGYASSGRRVLSGGHVEGVLGGVMESLCVLARRGEETPLCWDARGALRGALVTTWIEGDQWSFAPDHERDRAPYWYDIHLIDPRAYELAARAVARDLPAFLNRNPELRDELLRRVLV